MRIIEEAKNLIVDGKARLVFIKNDKIVLTKTRFGVGAALEAFENDRELVNGADVVDKIVGKGAGMIFALCGVQSVYALVISKSAIEVLHQNGIDVGWEKCVDFIKNKNGDDVCPIEQCVANISNLQEGLEAIRHCISKL